MSAQGHGNKTYTYAGGATHNIKSYRLKYTNAVNVISQNQGQGSVPLSVMRGKKVDVLVLEVRIGDTQEQLDYMSAISAYRLSNTQSPRNIFMAGSLLIASAGYGFQEIPSGSKWFVNSWRVREGVSQRIMHGDLELYRWYE